MTKDEILELATRGVSIHAAFVGNDEWPEPFQVYGFAFSADGKYLRALVSQRLFPKLHQISHTEKQVAITYAQPLSYLTAQVKGFARKLRPLQSEEIKIFEEWFEKLSYELECIGTAKETIFALNIKPDSVLECEVASYFLQTPGPKAGTRI